jgi:hypothetical protein
MGIDEGRKKADATEEKLKMKKKIKIDELSKKKIITRTRTN